MPERNPSVPVGPTNPTIKRRLSPPGTSAGPPDCVNPLATPKTETRRSSEYPSPEEMFFTSVAAAPNCAPSRMLPNTISGGKKAAFASRYTFP